MRLDDCSQHSGQGQRWRDSDRPIHPQAQCAACRLWFYIPTKFWKEKP